MLTRIYLDNFRCFVNFEFRPDKKQLILGANGAGKSSWIDALEILKQFSVYGDKLDDFNLLNQRTRWIDSDQQTFELEAALDGQKYVYRLVLDSVGEPPRARVISETVALGGKPIFEFVRGEVHLYNDFSAGPKVTFPFDWYRSALATITSRPDNQKLTRFREWFSRLLCFRINPFQMPARAEAEDAQPKMDLSNMAAWYRHLLQSSRQEDSAFLADLRNSLSGFQYLGFTEAAENVRVLLCDFSELKGKTLKFSFNELSEGQRCLICLYAIEHFVLSKSATVVLDEPDNFISLREIQPWLNNASDAIEENKGQLLIVSHHPELINQWGPEFGVRFVREGLGPVRVVRFEADNNDALTPAEVVARGWEDDSALEPRSP